jgi:hypothetical protein
MAVVYSGMISNKIWQKLIKDTGSSVPLMWDVC